MFIIYFPCGGVARKLNTYIQVPQFTVDQKGIVLSGQPLTYFIDQQTLHHFIEAPQQPKVMVAMLVCWSYLEKSCV